MTATLLVFPFNVQIRSSNKFYGLEISTEFSVPGPKLGCHRETCVHTLFLIDLFALFRAEYFFISNAEEQKKSLSRVNAKIFVIYFYTIAEEKYFPKQRENFLCIRIYVFCLEESERTITAYSNLFFS